TDEPASCHAPPRESAIPERFPGPCGEPAIRGDSRRGTAVEIGKETPMTVAITHGALELRPSTNTDLGCLTVSFQRTLRIPDDGRTYPLPPGLGEFPLRLVRDYAHRVPAAWARRGGVILPMYQREAMWLCFGGSPHALKVGIGKVCAISGEPWSDGLRPYPQNYV